MKQCIAPFTVITRTTLRRAPLTHSPKAITLYFVSLYSRLNLSQRARILLSGAILATLGAPLVQAAPMVKPVQTGPTSGLKILCLGLILALIFTVIWGLVHRKKLHQLQDEVAEHEAILVTVLATTPLAILDDKGRIKRANQAVSDLFDQPASELIDQDFTQLVPGFDLAAPATDSPTELIGIKADQARFPLSLQTSLIPGPNKAHHLALHISDLSRWHAADAQSRELHAQLNKVWRLNSLGEMAATLAHELNQPLSAAATYLHASQSETERLGKLGENASRTSNLAKEQLLRAGQIIRRMRDLLSLEVRSLDREQASSMVEDLSPVLTMIASAKGVRIDLKMDRDNDIVRADRIQFQQAIVNLVRNAVEASFDQKHPRVLVRGRATSENSYEVVVEDNGPGLPPEEVERMFQPMTTTKSGGMGLGLSVTRTIVERHGGRLIGKKSALGGAAFSFNLIRDPLDRDL